MLAPAPLAHQLGWLTPQPMKSAANRLGNGAGSPPVAAMAPQTGTDSSHGKAIVTPAPRKNVRRDAWWIPARVISGSMALMVSQSSALPLSTRLFKNCGLVTIVSTRLLKRSPLAASRSRIASMVSSSEGNTLRPNP